MGLLKIFKTARAEERLLKRAETLLVNGKIKQAERTLSRIADKFASEPATDDERKEHGVYHTLLAKTLLQNRDASAIPHVLTAYRYTGDESLLREGAFLIERLGLIEPDATRLILTLSEETTGERGFLLTYAKRIVEKKKTNLTPEEHEVVLSATKAFTLWKGGSDLLAEEFLSAEREDAEAISVYRIAYPNRKDDKRLVDKLIKHLVELEERSDFSAQVYEDYLAGGEEDKGVLKLLVEYYIEKKEVTPQTISFIEGAVKQGLLDREHMEALSAYILRTRKEFLNKKALLLDIYRSGYYNKNILAFLAMAFAEEGNFTDEALKAYEDALKNNLLTKRITLLLAEHFLNEDRSDEFACRVYEHYLSSWPERRQPRIYLLLSRNYAGKKRTDEQAQKIYEDALAHFPEYTDVLPYLAASYLTYETRQPKAFAVYEKAYPILEDEYLKRQVALILAEERLESSNFDRRTLEYIETALPLASERRRARLIDARTKCYLALERRDPQALKIYLELYQKNPEESAENLRLISILSDALLNVDKELEVPEELRMQIIYKRFELEKYGCPEKVAFFLLKDVLHNNSGYKYTLPLVVRCFEVNAERAAEELHEADRIDLLKDVGTFYLERYNYSLSAQAFAIRNRYEPSEENTYHLAKIILYDGNVAEARKMLSSVKTPTLKPNVIYWQVAALQQENKPKEAERFISLLRENVDSIPRFLVNIREGINAELNGDYDNAISAYNSALEDDGSKAFRRWLQIEIGLARFRKGDVEQAVKNFSALYRSNPNGRAEQKNYSYVLLYHAHLKMREGKWDEALQAVQECADVNRNDRLLRSVAVDLLLHWGKYFFFRRDYKMTTKILEVAHQILPRDLTVKTYLAYSYHLMHNYQQALIYYRDITWSDDAPMLEKSQAYCYMSNGQTGKAWRVFLDLKKRGTLSADEIPLLITAFLSDREAEGGKVFKDLEFPEDLNAPVLFSAFYIHDGLYDRALSLLAKTKKTQTQELQKLWFMGKASALKGDRKLAVAYWQELLNKCIERETHTETKISQLLEIGLAFLKAGYAQEAMQTWEKLKELSPDYVHIQRLYAYTLDLNAYLLAQKGNLKLAIGEWEKSTSYDPTNTSILHNLAIAYMMADDFDLSAIHWRKVTSRWQVMVDRNPQAYAHLSVAIGEVERLLSDVFVARRRLEEDAYIAKTEEMVDYFQRANQFYWILGLDKRATRGQIEKSYFRLIKIFDPERHPADFMLLEEAYASLTDETRREKVDLFVFNPVDVDRLHQITFGTEDTASIFEELGLTAHIPGPNYTQLSPDERNPEEIISQLTNTLGIYFRLGDQAVV